MRALVLAACIATGLTAACGGRGPTTPTGTSSGLPLSLASGAYTLSITMSESGDCTPVPGTTFCTGLSLCVIPAGAALVTGPVPLAVTVKRDGDALTILPDDSSATFAMSLQMSGTSVSGTASGVYTSGTVTVSVDGTHPGDGALLAGTVSSTSVSGSLTGSVDLNSVGCSNNGHHWSLTPR